MGRTPPPRLASAAGVEAVPNHLQLSFPRQVFHTPLDILSFLGTASVFRSCFSVPSLSPAQRSDLSIGLITVPRASSRRGPITGVLYDQGRSAFMHGTVLLSLTFALIL